MAMSSAVKGESVGHCQKNCDSRRRRSNYPLSMGINSNGVRMSLSQQPKGLSWSLAAECCFFGLKKPLAKSWDPGL